FDVTRVGAARRAFAVVASPDLDATVDLTFDRPAVDLTGVDFDGTGLEPLRRGRGLEGGMR
ncbi:MAG: hypothetical protein ACYDD7_18870, partial [Acidimicrobiales bacterium]